MYPFADVPLCTIAATEMIVNVVTPCGPSVDILGPNFNHLLAKAAPVLRLTVSSNFAFFNLLFDFLHISHVVISLEVVFETFASLKDLCTTPRLVQLHVLALPKLKLPMLAAFMTFPVVLAAESLRAVGKRASIRLLMPFFMFPMRPLAKTQRL